MNNDKQLVDLQLVTPFVFNKKALSQVCGLNQHLVRPLLGLEDKELQMVEPTPRWGESHSC